MTKAPRYTLQAIQSLNFTLHNLQRKILLCTALALMGVGTTPLLSQAPDKSWSKAYGGSFWEEGYGGTVADGDGFVLTGYTESFAQGESDLYLVKVDRFGDTLWTRSYGGQGREEGYSVDQIQEDKGFIVAGRITAEIDAPDIAWLLRTDSKGDTLWTYTWTNDPGRIYTPSNVREMPDGNFIVVGNAAYVGEEKIDGWISVVDGEGQLLWSRTYQSQMFLGFSSVDFMPDNGLAIAGVISVPKGFAGFLLLTDAGGDTITSHTFSTAGTSSFTWVRRKPDGTLLCVGATIPFGSEDWDALAVEYNFSAVPQTVQAKTFGGSNSEIGNSAVLTTDGGYAIAGNVTDPATSDVNAWIVRVDNNGTVRWNEQYGGTGFDKATGIFSTEEGGYWVVGSTAASESSSSDAWLMRLSADPASSVDYSAATAGTTGGLYVQDPAPNPFDRSTEIRWQMEKGGHVEITVQDMSGRTVRELMNERLSPGSYRTEWNGSGAASNLMPAGTYLCTVSVDGQTLASKKIVLSR